MGSWVVWLQWSSQALKVPPQLPYTWSSLFTGHCLQTGMSLSTKFNRISLSTKFNHISLCAKFNCLQSSTVYLCLQSLTTYLCLQSSNVYLCLQSWSWTKRQLHRTEPISPLIKYINANKINVLVSVNFSCFEDIVLSSTCTCTHAQSNKCT